MQQNLFWFSLANIKGPAKTWLAGWAYRPAFSAELGTEQGWEVIGEVEPNSPILSSTSRSADVGHGPRTTFSS